MVFARRTRATDGSVLVVCCIWLLRTCQLVDPLLLPKSDSSKVIGLSVAEVRTLVLVILLGVSVRSGAQSTDADSRIDSGVKVDNSQSSDPQSPLRPGDDVGGSWNGVLLYGRMTDASMFDVATFNYGWEEAKLFSGEIGYTLKEDNVITQFLSPILSSVDVALNVTYQNDPAGNIFLFNPYIMARWSNFPWSDTIRTTFGFGGGLSFATDVPSIEKKPSEPNGDYSKVQHYLAVEATFALPKHKDWQLVYRLHHRSGVFGVMQSDNVGNTAVQIGIRHYFK